MRAIGPTKSPREAMLRFDKPEERSDRLVVEPQ
jgi:hypothetical protein